MINDHIFLDRKHLLFLQAAFIALIIQGSLANAAEKVVYNFPWADDEFVAIPLVADKAGNLYGSSYDVVANSGNIFELSPPPTVTGSWTQTTIFTFADGSYPRAALVLDSSGNIYGTTYEGGNGVCNYGAHCGLIFELSPPVPPNQTWTETVLYEFQGGNDGAFPLSPLSRDAAGNLYGSTSAGGMYGCGVVFKLSPTTPPTETLLHQFNCTDGSYPSGPLVLNSTGLYGTTVGGGNSANCIGGCGTVFQLTHTGIFQSLYSFNSGNDGLSPLGVVADRSGDLFGVTNGGGTTGSGTVFELMLSGTTWNESVLYSFMDSDDGGLPFGIMIDKVGDLYGATYAGGLSAYCGWNEPFTGCGVVFKLTPPAPGGTWTESVLHAFNDSSNPQHPDGAVPLGVTLGKFGLLYSPTQIGGTGLCYTGKGNDCGCGTVVALSP